MRFFQLTAQMSQKMFTPAATSAEASEASLIAFYNHCMGLSDVSV